MEASIFLFSGSFDLPLLSRKGKTKKSKLGTALVSRVIDAALAQNDIDSSLY